MPRDVEELTDQEVERLRGELDRLWGRLEQFEEDTVALLQREYMRSVREAIGRLEEVLAGVEIDEAGNIVPDANVAAEGRLAALESVQATEEIWREWRGRLEDIDGQLDEYYKVAEGVDDLGIASDEVIGELLGQWPADGQPGTGLAGRFYSMSDHHRRQLADAVTRNVLNGASRRQLTQELTEATEMAEQQAEQRLRDSTIQYSRSVNEQKASELGYDYREYIGPEDDLTRPFCDRLLDEGPIWKVEKIRKLDNGQTGAGTVLRAGGGYNCRHHWRAVKPWMMIEGEDWDEMTADKGVSNGQIREEPHRDGQGNLTDGGYTVLEDKAAAHSESSDSTKSYFYGDREEAERRSLEAAQQAEDEGRWSEGDNSNVAYVRLDEDPVGVNTYGGGDEPTQWARVVRRDNGNTHAFPDTPPHERDDS